MGFWSYATSGSLAPMPGAEKDDVFYESIAYNLAHGNGFSLNFDDPQWQEPYRENNTDGRNDWIFDAKVAGPTTTRGPGFPFAASLIYRALGRQWAWVYLLNACCLGIGLSWLIVFTVRRFGFLIGCFALVTLCCDFAVLRTATQFMSDSIGTGCIAILFCLVVAASGRINTWQWFVVGIVFGATLLVRTVLTAWLMQIIVVSLLICVVQMTRGKSWMVLAWSAVAFLIPVVIMNAPWWNRNIAVTGHFAPFGTAGSIGTAGGFSDGAYANFGNWDLPKVVEVQRETIEKHDLSGLSLPQQEFLMGQESKGVAWKWISEKRNWIKMPVLFVGKALNHLGLVGHAFPLVVINGLLLFGAVLGCLFDRRRFGFWIAAFVFMSLATTVLTWSHYGRYSIPIRPLLHVGCAIGTIQLWAAIIRWMRGWAGTQALSQDSVG